MILLGLFCFKVFFISKIYDCCSLSAFPRSKSVAVFWCVIFTLSACASSYEKQLSPSYSLLNTSAKSILIFDQQNVVFSCPCSFPVVINNPINKLFLHSCCFFFCVLIHLEAVKQPQCALCCDLFCWSEQLQRKQNQAQCHWLKTAWFAQIVLRVQQYHRDKVRKRCWHIVYSLDMPSHGHKQADCSAVNGWMRLSINM